MKHVVLLLCVLLTLTADARNRKVKIITSKGTIVVKSKEHVGSTFTIVMPYVIGKATKLSKQSFKL